MFYNNIDPMVIANMLVLLYVLTLKLINAHFAVTTEESVSVIIEQTTQGPTNLPDTTAMTTDSETTPPPTAPPIELITLRGPRTGDPVVFVNGYVCYVSFRATAIITY